MAAVEGPDAHGERKIEGGLARPEDEVLDAHLAEAEHTCLDLGARTAPCPGDGGG
jgi:hypothetical protein